MSGVIIVVMAIIDILIVFFNNSVTIKCILKKIDSLLNREYINIKKIKKNNYVI